ncbi:MAG: ABC transporter substrate-binding protein [Oscillospiraceae bacterium]|nr:ABC transporter substrate-binding protein [Oscillospiraceae bacterium]
MKKFLALIMAVAMVCCLFTGCGSSSSSTTSTADSSSSAGDSAAADDSASTADAASDEGSGEIVIALIANTTGDYAMYGVPVRNGAMLYIDQLNEAGGINGKQITVLEYDDKGDGLEAVNAFNLAMEQGISAVIGSVLTSPTITLADATYEANVPQITASATAAGVTRLDPDDDASGIRTNVFRSCFIDPFQGSKMADYAVNKLGASTAAILYESGSDYSEGLMDAFVETADELGLEIVATEAFATGDKDYSAQMTNIAAANPDVVFMPIYYGEAGLAVTQGRQAGLTATIMGADGWGSVSEYASAEDLEGSVYCSGYAPGTESVAQFEADYEEVYGEPVPNMFAPLAYDAAMLLCNAIAEAEAQGLTAGSDAYRQAIIDALDATDGTEGITGTYTFDEYNDPIKSAAILRVEDGSENFVELY